MQNTKKLSLFSFFAMTASLFITVYEYPTFAESGKTLIFLSLVCGLFWFLPVALCAAEIGTVEAFDGGGIFGWVGKTLGEKFGFAAIFFQWFQITVGFVTMSYFIIGALSYALKCPEMNDNKLIKFLVVVLIFWLLTFLQFKGTNTTSQIAKAGFVIGIIIPVTVLLIFTIKYVMSGHTITHSFMDKSFFPNKQTFSSLVTFILAYVGVEASASHIKSLDNPQKNYPLMMIYLVITGIVLSTIGGTTVSMVVPARNLSLNSGVIQAFETLILKGNPHLSWLVEILAIMLAFGVLAQVSSWIVSPTEGLRYVADQGLLPKSCQKINKNGVPTSLLIIQGVIVTIWAAVLTFGGGGNAVSFLTAISLTVVIYLCGYLLFFIGYFVLIFKKSNQQLKRAYEVPGGRKVKALLASLGMVMSLLALVSSFIAPSELKANEAKTYLITLAFSSVITVLLPFVFYHIYVKKHSINLNNEERK
ncbi:amino acid permease [Vagococcus teuberi]